MVWRKVLSPSKQMFRKDKESMGTQKAWAVRPGTTRDQQSVRGDTAEAAGGGGVHVDVRSQLCFTGSGASRSGTNRALVKNHA